ncbi:hypothetical protein L6452_00293 [Arctium lappa]|uniref:Uncharacterized protein n=1 Tax=Arctium lappa TaxID=4217 RepID=A0ACB9FCX9_ARCLA|nr:hypothetical protein L6452_00293 [Arctium lappa]
MKGWMEQIQKKRSKIYELYLVLFISIFFSCCWCCYLFLRNSSPVNVALIWSMIRLLVTHNVDKTYVFLICNGILVVLMKTSGSLISESKFDLNHHIYIKTIHESLHTQDDQDHHHLLMPELDDDRKEIVIRVDWKQEEEEELHKEEVTLNL